jgi:hypothetical protein
MSRQWQPQVCSMSALTWRCAIFMIVWTFLTIFLEQGIAKITTLKKNSLDTQTAARKRFKAFSHKQGEESFWSYVVMLSGVRPSSPQIKSVLRTLSDCRSLQLQCLTYSLHPVKQIPWRQQVLDFKSRHGSVQVSDSCIYKYVCVCVRIISNIIQHNNVLVCSSKSITYSSIQSRECTKTPPALPCLRSHLSSSL